MSSQEIKKVKEELLRLSGDDKKRERYERRKNLILNGLDNELISKSTGLSLEEIKNLKSK